MEAPRLGEKILTFYSKLLILLVIPILESVWHSPPIV